ncbi:MAG: GAF domain-containing protein [Bacteroidia bacterium]|nr:GAF domain-containing protein [Bacteroidia bacterium]MCZ2276517.1 GAF domain-containing protein [Bacteroidia bacterium]
MSEITISGISQLSKTEKYKLLIQTAGTLLNKESDTIANLSNICALIKQIFDFHWCGFYRVVTVNNFSELIVGPFQGPVACSRIGYAQGVCGTVWKEKRLLNVENVSRFPGHIACSPDSKSEIVIPVFSKQEVVMVLDIDSSRLNDFDDTDETYLSSLAEMVSTIL